MKNLPKPIRIIILAGALVGIGYFWYLAWKTETNKSPNTTNAPITTNENTNMSIDFIKTGTITFNNPGLKENTPYFIFEEPGSPALSKEIVTDGDSVCFFQSKPLPCQTMDIKSAYNEKRVNIEGVNQTDGSLLLKKLGLEKKN